MSIKRVIAVARRELGYTESPPGSNRTKYGEAFGWDGVPWCVIFLWWCFREAGESMAFFGGGKTASCGTLLRWYQAQGQTVPVEDVRAGDIVILNFSGTKETQHCGLVDSIVAGDFSAQRNSGVSITYAGTSTDYVPERLTMLEGIDWSEIDYITIAYGTNDWNSNYGLDNENDPDDTTTYIGAFRYSVEKLLAAYPNIKIFVITPLWRWWDTNTGMPSEIHADYIDSNDYAKGTGYKLWQYGDALAVAAKLYHIPVFDLYWNCMMTKQNRFEYFDTNDGTHPKEAGRYLMAQMISAWLSAKY